MKIYIFKDLNYYIGNDLSDNMKNKAVIFETEYQEGKTPVVMHDKTGVTIEWVEEVLDEL